MNKIPAILNLLVSQALSLGFNQKWKDRPLPKPAKGYGICYNAPQIVGITVCLCRVFINFL